MTSDRPGSEEELFHILEEKFLRLGIAKVERIVVDELLLRLEPLRPADVADLFVGAETELILEGSETHLVALLPAPGACDGCHAGKIARGLALFHGVAKWHIRLPGAVPRLLACGATTT